MSRPRIRTVKPEIWEDERIGRVSRDARLLFIALITCADDAGRLLALPATIIGHSFPYDSDAPRKLEGWFRELESVGLAHRYEHAGVPYAHLPNWLKHQRIDKPSPSRIPEPASPNGRGGFDD